MLVLEASSGPRTKGVPTNNQRGRGSGPCLLWRGLDKARHIVPNALFVRVQCFRNDLYKAVKGQAQDLSYSRWSLGHTDDAEGVWLFSRQTRRNSHLTLLSLYILIKRFFGKLKSNVYQNYLIRTWLCFEYFSEGSCMLYFLFRVTQCYRIRQGSWIWAVHRFSSMQLVAKHVDLKWCLPRVSPSGCLNFKVNQIFKSPDLLGNKIKLCSLQNVHDRRRSSKGKFPWIEYNGQEIADSSFCVRFVNQTFGVDLNKGLSKTERAIAYACQKMIEENTYW